MNLPKINVSHGPVDLNQHSSTRRDIPWSYRKTRTLVSLAVLLSLLGSGNIIFGNDKASEYQALLLRGTAALASPADTSPRGTSPESALDRQAAYLDKVGARLAFYNLVVLTGKGLLALAGLLLLAILLGGRADNGTSTQANS